MFINSQNDEMFVSMARLVFPYSEIQSRFPPVWPDKNRQMSRKVAQKWLH